MQCSLSDSSGCHFVHMRTFMFHISNLWVLCLILKQHQWICPYISRHLLSLNPLQARCRRYSRGE
ncbi:hypothetical protein FY860_22170, partial [Escherichia coli]|nr:hypothetical protein [Escherichia coli]